MQIENQVGVEQLRNLKRWVGTLESMLWVIQATPMQAGKGKSWTRQEDLSLCWYLRDLIERGRQQLKHPVFARELRDFEDEYRAGAAWFHELMRERDPHWKM